MTATAMSDPATAAAAQTRRVYNVAKRSIGKSVSDGSLRQSSGIRNMARIVTAQTLGIDLKLVKRFLSATGGNRTTPTYRSQRP